jgi:arthrofactin-type cyclic lipopeptide synthetase C
VMFSWQNNDYPALKLPGLQVSVAGGALDQVRFDLELALAEDPSTGAISGVLSYSTALFDSATMERHCSYLLRLLEGMVQTSDRPVEQIELLGAEEKNLLLSDWNQTQAPYPKGRCIHELFEQQVQKTPEAGAVVQGEETLTYAKLNGLANRLAYQLIERGVKPGAYVAILLERGIPLVVAELAILKVGGAYVPLDPKMPAERQAWMIADCAAHLLITDKRAALPKGDTPVLIIEAIPDKPGTDSDPNLPFSSEQTAYVMYTSGSTGTPKGVLVPHRAVNRLVISCGYVHFDATDRVAFASNPAFDATTMEVWAPLLNGGCIVVIDSDTSLDAQRFAEALSRHEVTALFLTTALFNQHVLSIPSALARLKYLLCGGEREDPESFALLLKEGGPEHLIHCYGPTETTTFATTYDVPRSDQPVNRLPIGRPIANTRTYLLDSCGQPVPRGVTGELYIGGEGVALGYLNRPELTAERFLNDPFSPGARMYRTGDLARYLPDGNLEFLGRNDSQVKIRGFRIEPGEIEARLIQHPAVGEAVVIAREDTPGNKRLVAYVTVHQEAPQDLPSVLRAHLSSALPEYMVPSAYVRLEALPLNANGKIDRRTLPIPQDEAYVRQAYQPPEGETEIALAQLWEELLDVEQVSRNDHFFELGGHSLLAVQMIARAQELGLKISVNELFHNPLLRDLAKIATGEFHSSDSTRAIPARRTGAQRPLFFVPTGLGDPTYVFEVAKDLDPEIPVYALPWQSLEEPQLLTMQAMAARMVAMIQAIQPQGPYRLAGYSSGGILAYAIAEHFLGIDQAIEFLGFIDVKPPPAKGKEPTTARQMLVDYIKNSEHPEIRSRIDLLSQFATELSPAQFMQECQTRGLMPADRDPHAEAMSWEQKAIFDNAVTSYRALPLPVIVHQFHATEIVGSLGADDPETAKLIAEVRTERNGSEIDSRILDWERILPVASIQLVPVPGNHITMVAEAAHRKVLATRFSEILCSEARPRNTGAIAFNPLISLHAPRSSEFPLFCIPGAGANITTFSDFVLALDGRLPVYGFQPRGIDALNPPHNSIEAAATCNLQRLAQLEASGPVHLLGHSHGASVAFDMARCLQAEGRLVASLTLLDGEPPDPKEMKARDLGDRQIFEEFVSAISRTFERAISIDEELLATGESELLLAQLHSQLLAAGVLPPRSRPSLLRGPLTTFAAARRTVYSPATPYRGKARVVLVDDPAMDADANLKQRQLYLSGWQSSVSELDSWNGPGNHYSMLRPPHVNALAKWWWDGLSRSAF